MVYSVLGAVESRTAAAPVVLPLGNDGSRLRSSRRHGSNLRGLLRFHGTCHVRMDKIPKMNNTKSKRSSQRLLAFSNFKYNRLLGDSIFDQ